MSCTINEKHNSLLLEAGQVYQLRQKPEHVFTILEVVYIENYPQFSRVILQEQGTLRLLDYNIGKFKDSILAEFYVKKGE